MGRYILVVNSDPVAGGEEEFANWYDDVHLADIARIPGVMSARRYVPDASSPMPTPSASLAIYELDCRNPGAVLAEITRRASSGEMVVSKALDISSVRMTLFKSA